MRSGRCIFLPEFLNGTLRCKQPTYLAILSPLLVGKVELHQRNTQSAERVMRNAVELSQGIWRIHGDCSPYSGLLQCSMAYPRVLGISSQSYDTLLLRELDVLTTQRVRRGSRNGAWRTQGTFTFRNQLQWWHALSFTLQFMKIVKTGGMELM